MNRQMSILKAIGIILVVLGHRDVRGTFFPIYSFHVPLFFFVSGYFYKTCYDTQKLLFLKKKISSLLAPYFAYNLLYLLISFFLYKTLDVTLGKPFSGRNFFIEPFLSGHQYHLFLAAWFVTQLFVIQIVFNILHPLLDRLRANYVQKTLFFLILAVLSTYLSKLGYNKSLYLLLTRTLMGIFFYYLGFFFKEKIEARNIYKTEVLFLILLVQFVLVHKYHDLDFFMVWSDYKGHVFLPIATSITGIYICLFISKCFSYIVNDNDILIKIGNNSFHIMANHFLVFFVINFLAIKITGSEVSNLNSIWYFFDRRYWIVYVVAGVFVPLLFSTCFNKCSKQICPLLFGRLGK